MKKMQNEITLCVMAMKKEDSDISYSKNYTISFNDEDNLNEIIVDLRNKLEKRGYAKIHFQFVGYVQWLTKD